jgi:hypothetical protein
VSSELANILRWDPWHGGDPGPEIWQIIQELDKAHQVRAVNVLVDVRIASLQAQLHGYQQLKEIVGKAAG